MDYSRRMSVFLLLQIVVICYLQAAMAVELNDDFKAIDTFVKAGMACHPENPGLSLSVVYNDNVLISKGYGVKSLHEEQPVTNETLFGIASMSKAFASTLILMLIEEHKNLSLWTKVKDILKNDDIFYDSLRSSYTTLEDLMAHRLGIPSNNNIRLDDTLTRENLVERLQYLKPVGGFRTSSYYSNIMYGLLTYIAEVIGQKRWEDQIKEKIFVPLSMTSSTFATIADRSTLDVAQGYQNKSGGLFPVPSDFSRRWALLSGSGSVLSSSNDMIHWMKFHLNRGTNSDGKVVLDEDILRRAYENQNSVHTPFSEEFYTRPITPITWALDNYGLGWKMGYYRGYKVITHSGSTYGYRALITLVPELKIGVFTAMTGDDPKTILRTNIHSYIIDVISGDLPWLNSSSVCTFPEPWQKKKKKSRSTFDKNLSPTRDLKFYTGVFKNPAYGQGEAYVNITSKQLMIKIGFGLFVLHPKSEKDEFYAEGFGIVAKSKNFSKFRFQFTENEAYASALIVPSFNSKYPPIFKRVDNVKSRNIRSNSNIERVGMTTAAMATAYYLLIVECF